jgi:hypothetical protein
MGVFIANPRLNALLQIEVNWGTDKGFGVPWPDRVDDEDPAVSGLDGDIQREYHCAARVLE